MKKTGLTLQELKTILKKWQKDLLLDQWLLKIRIVEFKRKDYRQSGDIKVDWPKKQATILLTKNPFRPEEQVIVHELIHLLLWQFDHFCEKVILKNSKPHEGDHDRYLGQLEKQVSQITKILITQNKKRTG